MQPRHIRLPSWVGGSTVICYMVDAYSKSSRLFVSLSTTTYPGCMDRRVFPVGLSLTNLTVISLDRCYALSWPLSYRAKVTKRGDASFRL